MPSIADGEPAQYFKDYAVFFNTSDITKIVGSTGLYTDPKVPFIPGQLRTGDLDSDGKVDIITTVLMADNKPKTLVLLNEE